MPTRAHRYGRNGDGALFAFAMSTNVNNTGRLEGTMTMAGAFRLPMAHPNQPQLHPIAVECIRAAWRRSVEACGLTVAEARAMDGRGLSRWFEDYGQPNQVTIAQRYGVHPALMSRIVRQKSYRTFYVRWQWRRIAGVPT